jgi:hypothetical protein
MQPPSLVHPRYRHGVRAYESDETAERMTLASTFSRRFADLPRAGRRQSFCPAPAAMARYCRRHRRGRNRPLRGACPCRKLKLEHMFEFELRDNGENSAGRIHKDTPPRWIGSVNTSHIPLHLQITAWLQRWKKPKRNSEHATKNEGGERETVRMTAKVWTFYKFASTLTSIGIIEAKTEREAIDKAAEVFTVPANRLTGNPTK